VPVIHIWPPVAPPAIEPGESGGGVLLNVHCALPGVRVERAQDARQVVEVARHADDQVIANQQWRVGGPVALLRVRQSPQSHFSGAVARVQRDQVRRRASVR
jgi:hypothetical protein